MTTRSTIAKGQHPNKMKNSNTSDERSRIASKKELAQRITIAEQKTNNNRNKKEPAQRITIAKQTTNNNLDRKKAIVNNKTIKSAQRISIAKQETNDNRSKKDQQSTIAKRRKPVNKQISTIAKCKTNHYRVARNRPITIAKAHYNRMPKKRQFTIAKHKAYHNRTTTGAKYKANVNRSFCNSKEVLGISILGRGISPHIPYLTSPQLSLRGIFLARESNSRPQCAESATLPPTSPAR